MAPVVVFEPDRISHETAFGTDLLTCAHAAGVDIDAPCGGTGTCGKCKVYISDPSGEKEVLACQTPVEQDMIVRCEAPLENVILVEGTGRSVALAPSVSVLQVEVRRNELGNAQSDWERLVDAVAAAIGADAASIPVALHAADGLHGKLKECDNRPWIVVHEQTILDVRPYPVQVYAAAFDIGTTTMVCYLLDPSTGAILAHASMLNPQTQYGADVITRSIYATDGGIGELASCVRHGMNELAANACAAAGVSMHDVFLATVVGNTCMHHLFAHITPDALVAAPYNPTLRQMLALEARECGLDINPHAVVKLLPVIAGFVGADSTAAMLAAEFDSIDELSVLIDIGTNGEIMMTDGQRRVACSTAAGPAFEGAKIEQGMRGAKGAIDHVWVEDGMLRYSVIGDAAPIGLCGSGLIDGVAVLYENGLITKKGRMLQPDKLTRLAEDGSAPADLVDRFEYDDSGKRFVLAPEGESGEKRPICISQKDINELLLAKSAISIGVELLAEELGRSVAEIRHVFIAGAFGNYMTPHGACTIGLIAPQLEKQIRPIGNAAGEGACIAALSQEECARARRIAAQTQFLELALHPEFPKRFSRALSFPDVEN